MKKLIIMLASLLVAVSAHAQFGVVAGITSSSSNLKTAVSEVKNISQYHAGITYKIGFGNIFAVQPSIIYNMKGAKLSALSAATTADDFEYKTGYVEVPVQFQLGLGVGNIFRVYGFAEPFIGYAVTNTITSGTQTAQQTWDNIKNKAEYGVSFGAGLELIKHVQVSLKYFWNLGEVYKADPSAAVAKISDSGNCNGIAASVAILF